jgi:PGF-CTERM protein
MADRRIGAILFSLLLVVSAVSGGVGTVAAQDDAEADDDEFDPADEAYVSDNGDVVLVYRNDTDPGTEADFGLSVSRNVFHALVVTNQSESTDVTGEATGILEPNRIAANGSLAAPRPEEIESLQLEISGEQTDENAKMDASLEATLANTGASSFVTSADAAGEISVTPDEFAADAQFSADLERPMGEPQHHSFDLRETADGYVLQAEQDYTVSQFAAEQWNTEERARQTLQAQYASVANSMGGEAEVTLESYTFTNTSSERSAGRLDVAFTIEYTGIDEGLQRQVAASLESSEQFDLTREEAQRIGESVAELNVDQVSGEFEQTPESVSGSFTARLTNYEPALRGALTAVGNVQADTEEAEAMNLSSQIEAAEKRLDARRAAGLEETYSFDMSLETPARGTTDVTATLTYRTNNWADYREELRARDLDPASSTFAFQAQTHGEEVTASGSIEVEKEELLADATDRILNASNTTLDDDQQRFVKAFRDSKFRKARFDVRVKQDTVEIEAGAAFEDLSALRDALRATQDDFDLKVASVTGRTTDDGQVETYVLARGAVGPNATESDVRELQQVNDSTTVHLPGDHNRTFPEPDVERAYDYLELTPPPTATPTPDPDAESGVGISQPGFGFAAALVALLAAALLAARRRDP